MTVLVGGTKPINNHAPGFDILDFTAGSVTVATGSVYRVSHGSSFDELTGSFTYDSDGMLIGGTITGWKRVTDGGTEFIATGISVPVPTFLGYLANGDTAAFNDAVFGGDDKITGSGIFDVLSGSNGKDTVSGGSGSDDLFGGGDNDSLAGGAGGDQLIGEGGSDTMAGGAGDDYYYVDNTGDVVIESAGRGFDTVFVDFDYTLKANVERLALGGAAKGTGNKLANEIDGSTGNDTLEGKAGNDTLNGGAGLDQMTGGTGNDTYVVNSVGDSVVENPNEGTDTIQTNLLNFSLNAPAFVDIENLTMTGLGNSTGQGNDSANVIAGGSFNDTLAGLGGNDTINSGESADSLDGGTGADLMIGGNGGDIYSVDDVKDKVVESAGDQSGADTVNSKVSYVLSANIEDLALQGSATNGTGNASENTIFGNLVANKISGLAGTDFLFGSTGTDTLDGGGGADFLSGGTEADSLQGGAGNDDLLGDSGDDTLAGGAGNDRYIAPDAGDVVVEGAGQGIDTVLTSAADFTLDTKSLANVENLQLSNGGGAQGIGNSLNNKIEGSGGNDTLAGGSGNDTLDGGAGSDTLAGGKGNDVYVIDNAGDVVVENLKDGTDTVQTTVFSIDLGSGAFDNVENLILLAGAAVAKGNGLANVITGNGDDNLLDGGGGVDTLIGGGGNDVYVADDSKDRAVETAAVGSGFDLVNAKADYVLGANIEHLVLMDAAVKGTGNASDNKIAGNDLDNKLSGLSGADTVEGSLGNDTIDGGTGDDSLLGGDGDDSLIGGNGGDFLFGGAGADTLAGGASGGPGHANFLSGGDGNDKLIGGTGSDLLIGEAGADTMIGGAGNDGYDFDDAGDVAIEAKGQGIDSVVVTFDYKLAANLDDLLLTKGATHGQGNELGNFISVTQAPTNNTLEGFGGNDTLSGGAGDDQLIGGTGNDQYFIDSLLDQIVELSGEGIDEVWSDLVSTDLTAPAFANVENLVLTGPANSGFGNAGANAIRTSNGNSSDTLDGREGNDTLEGGQGNDTYRVDSAKDKIVESAGIPAGFDTVLATADYVLSANVEALTLEGVTVKGTGNALGNIVTGNDSANKLFGLAGNDLLNGNLGNDTLDGGTGNDALVGDFGDDSLSGGAGNDQLEGDDGNDTLAGGAGDDIYIIGLDDKVVEGAGLGIDIVRTNLFDFSLDTKGLANVENLALIYAGTATGGHGTGNSLNNSIEGGGGNDTLDGGLGNDTLNGGTGPDSLIGGKGDDLYVIDDFGDTVLELAGQGRDTVQSLVDFTLDVTGMVENLALFGTAVIGDGNDVANTIVGNNLNNTLLGEGGNDTLSGKDGQDSLNGGANNDLLDGGAGFDSLNGGGDNDRLNGGEGSDTLEGGSGVDTMIGGNGSDTYIVTETKDKITELAGADSGIDTVFATVDYVLSANVEYLTLEGIAAINGTGNALNNTIFGNDSANKIAGAAGNDDLRGQAGSDTLDGGAGDDVLDGGTAGDKLIGGAGFDRLDGGAGADSMAGGAGNDSYFVDDAADQVFEAVGQGLDGVTVTADISYTLVENVEDLNLRNGSDGTGNVLDNHISGNFASSGDNSMSGLGGNDTLTAGAGQDFMTGGTGRDTFFLRAGDSVVDFVTDFDAGTLGDTLDLSDLLTGFVAGESNPNAFVQFINAAGDTRVQVDVDGAANGANFVDVCLLQDVTLGSVNQAVVEGNLLLG